MLLEIQFLKDKLIVVKEGTVNKTGKNVDETQQSDISTKSVTQGFNEVVSVAGKESNQCLKTNAAVTLATFSSYYCWFNDFIIWFNFYTKVEQGRINRIFINLCCGVNVGNILR